MKLNDSTNIPNKPGIYKITNLENEKCYIGSSINLKKRIQKHYYELKNNIHNNKYLLRSFNKYSEENFQVEILKLFNDINKEKLLKLEEEYILSYDSLNSGYNLLLNHRDYFKNLNKSQEHIEKNIKRDSISVMCFDRFSGQFIKKFESVSEAAFYFKTSSSNISRICKGKLNHIKGCTFCYTNEYDKNKNYAKPHHWAINKKRSPEHIEKLRKSNQKNKGKKVYQYDLNWNFIKKFNSMLEAERENNLNKESLRRRIGLKTPFEGYYWMENKI